MSKVFGILIGIIAFCVFFTIIFEIGNNINSGYGVTVSSEYAETNNYYQGIGNSAQDNVLNISDKSPGGASGSVGSAGEDMQIGGIRAMAQIFQAPNNLKKVILGDGVNNTGIASKIGLDSRITNMAVAAIIFMTALILIGAILRNRI